MFSIDGSHCASTHGLVISVMILQILHCLSHQGSPYRTLMSINSFLLLFFKNLFIAYFWQCWVVIGLQHMVFLYLWRAGVTLCCGSWACSGSAVVAHRLSYSRACGISLDLGSNQVPCIGRGIIYHWGTKEVQMRVNFTSSSFWFEILKHCLDCLWVFICEEGSNFILVAQWQRVHLPMQETWVPPMIQEDPLGHGAIKHLWHRHNYWACALEPRSHNHKSPWPTTRGATKMRSLSITTWCSGVAPTLWN